MSSTEWHKIKESIYYTDGSWRDIYVLDTTLDDWRKWIDFINQNYSLEFYNGQTQQLETTINQKVVFENLERKSDFGNSSSVKLENIAINCHFFVIHKIENDFDPEEIKNIEEHQRLVKYLIAVSKLLNKKVILTAENDPDLVYITVDKKS